MVITLEVNSDLGAKLAQEANRQGVSLDQFVLQAALNALAQRASENGFGHRGPSVDIHLRNAGTRNRTAAEESERLGITDTQGNRICTALPEDMREGVDRDFGG